MQTRKYAILPMLFILLSSSVVPFSYASVESEAQEDIQAGCPHGEIMVYRIISKQYVCVVPSTADRWVELGLAEIISENFVEFEKEIVSEIVTEDPKIPTPPPVPTKKPSISIENSECRDGYTLVYRFIHHDTFCTSPSTAASWERLGLAEIVSDKNLIDEETRDEETRDEETRDEETRDEETRDEETRDEETRDEETRDEETRDEETRDEETRDEETRDEETQSSSVNTVIPTPLRESKILGLNDRVWVAVGYDSTSSVLIEGDTGVIVIDPSSSSEISNKVLEEFRLISDKPIKTIIYTKLDPNHVKGSEAYLEQGDGSVEIITNEELLFLYNEKYDLDAQITHPFSDTFSLDISGVKMILFVGEGDHSAQTYISLPDDEGLMIGDTIYGIFPVLLDVNYFKSLDSE